MKEDCTFVSFWVCIADRELGPDAAVHAQGAQGQGLGSAEGKPLGAGTPPPRRKAKLPISLSSIGWVVATMVGHLCFTRDALCQRRPVRCCFSSLAVPCAALHASHMFH